MAASSLLALIDDIASVLDDVAAMSKLAAKKTTGVLGDDLALNAEQVSGIRAERELPVVWAVTKGSLKNKLILVPAALLISAFLPQAVMVLLMLGGAFLCFEGVEKVLHTFFHPAAAREEKKQLKNALVKSPQQLLAFEKEKIRGAIRTDFILSAEIIVIVLGSVADADLLTRVIVVSLLALAFTLGVYGIVAAIVKMDDAGLWLSEREGDRVAIRLQQFMGRGLLAAAPKLMKLLSVVGTIAMFLVGGGILTHGLPALEHLSHALTSQLLDGLSGWLAATGQALLPLLFNMIAGLVAGGILVAGFTLIKRIRGQDSAAH
ncbi:MAG: hypothetical protein CMI02_15625 [Oceanospirillaceae bacterium]|nr:hypothetical protein [Oceanospirillaceae bacterium]|tara:strand:+ start:103287 stop:104246 length:960 start_codon:yes stop_codon:yes gene_type:complete